MLDHVHDLGFKIDQDFDYIESAQSSYLTVHAIVTNCQIFPVTSLIR